MGCISYKINFHLQFQLLQIKCNFDHLKFIYLAGNFSSIVEDSHDLVQNAIEGLDHNKRISMKCFSKKRSRYCIKQIYLLFFGLRWQEGLVLLLFKDLHLELEVAWKWQWFVGILTLFISPINFINSLIFN